MPSFSLATYSTCPEDSSLCPFSVDKAGTEFVASEKERRASFICQVNLDINTFHHPLLMQSKSPHKCRHSFVRKSHCKHCLVIVF
jgi:hypothetical protein